MPDTALLTCRELANLHAADIGEFQSRFPAEVVGRSAQRGDVATLKNIAPPRDDGARCG
jgi:hypothetical protein